MEYNEMIWTTELNNETGVRLGIKQLRCLFFIGCICPSEVDLTYQVSTCSSVCTLKVDVSFEIVKKGLGKKQPV